jgi:hypothetical protein
VIFGMKFFILNRIYAIYSLCSLDGNIIIHC